MMVSVCRGVVLRAEVTNYTAFILIEAIHRGRVTTEHCRLDLAPSSDVVRGKRNFPLSCHCFMNFMKSCRKQEQN